MLARSSGGEGPGTHRWGRAGSSPGDGRGPGNRVPLYGHRSPRPSGRVAAASRPARCRGPVRGGDRGSWRSTCGASCGSGDSRPAWPAFPSGTAAIVFCEARLSIGWPPSCRSCCSTWRGVDPAGVGRTASRNLSRGKDDRGHSGRSPCPRTWDGVKKISSLIPRFGEVSGEPRATTSRLPFFIPRDPAE